jgi:hypothetical protein
LEIKHIIQRKDDHRDDKGSEGNCKDNDAYFPHARIDPNMSVKPKSTVNKRFDYDGDQYHNGGYLHVIQEELSQLQPQNKTGDNRNGNKKQVDIQ